MSKRILTLADLSHPTPSKSTSNKYPRLPPIILIWPSDRLHIEKLYNRTQNGHNFNPMFEGWISSSISWSMTRSWSKVHGLPAKTLFLSHWFANWTTKRPFSIFLKRAALAMSQIWSRVRFWASKLKVLTVITFPTNIRSKLLLSLVSRTSSSAMIRYSSAVILKLETLKAISLVIRPTTIPRGITRLDKSSGMNGVPRLGNPNSETQILEKLRERQLFKILYGLYYVITTSLTDYYQ